ncbi:hypothetical protein SARC_13632, partial [Sphaeroforma arctica JP610]
RKESSGCLRNWDFGADAHALQNADVFHSLRSGLEKTVKAYVNNVAQDQAQPKILELTHKLSLTIENCLTLLLTLCESTDNAMGKFQEHSYLEVLLYMLTSPQAPGASVNVAPQHTMLATHMRLLVCQCLYTISEDNEPLAATLLGLPTAMAILTQTAQPIAFQNTANYTKPEMQVCLLSVVCTGILYNLSSTKAAAQASTSITPNLMAPLRVVLGVDMLGALPALLPLIAQASQIDSDKNALAQFAQSMGGKETAEEKSKRLAETTVLDAVETARIAVKAQQLALEIYSNVLSDEYDNEDDGSDAEMEEWDDIDEQSDNIQADTAMTSSVAHSADRRGSTCDADIQALLLARCVPCPAHIRQVLTSTSVGRDFHENLGITQCRAVGALNNLCLADKPSTKPRYTTHPNDLWKKLTLVLFMSNGDTDLIAATTGAMWTLLRSVETPSELISVRDLPVASCEKICNHVLSSDEGTRTTIAGLVGCLGQMIAPEHRDSHTMILKVLLHLLEDICADVTAETLNSLYDAYAEPEFNNEMVALGYMQKLQTIGTTIKRKVSMHMI